jgi:hypothetical protein
MKRIAALTLLAAFVFVSCSSGGGDGGPTAPSEVMEGTFILQQLTATEGTTVTTFTPPAVTGQIIVTPDGRFQATMDMPIGGVSGTWTGSYFVSGTSLTLNYDDGNVEVWTISPDRTQVSTTEVEGTITITIVFVRA